MHARSTVIDTGLGQLTLAEADGALTGLFFPEHWHPPLPGLLGEPVPPGDVPVFVDAARQLGEFLDGARTAFDLPTAPVGSAFETQVWALLAEIPYGSTTTYGALAAQLGGPGLARRVGQAVGRNPVSIVIPCHRVIGASGSLTGYAGGLDRKRLLLELERPADGLF